MLTERLTEIDRGLARLRTAERDRATLTALRARSQQVTKLSSELLDKIEKLERVVRLGGRVTQPPQLSAALRQKPTDLVNRLADDPAIAVDAQLWDSTFKSPAEEFGKKVAQTALSAWQALVDKTAPAVPNDVLAQLDRMGFAQAVQKVRGALEDIQKRRALLPRDDRELSVIQEDAEAIAKATENLKAVPPAVTVFISKAASNNATLDDLTAEVTDWLRSNDMLKSIRIGFSK